MEFDVNDLRAPEDEVVYLSHDVLTVVNKRKSIIALASLFIAGSIVLIVVAFLHLNNPPSDFIPDTVVIIEPGSTARDVTTLLKEKRIVTSEAFLYLVLTLNYEPREIKASTYVFSEPLSTFAVAERLVTGEFGNDLIRFVHFEGERATHIAKEAETQLIDFDTEAFLARAVPLEGKLYPDTYFIPKTFTADELVDLMVKTFDQNITSLTPLIEASPLSLEEILILASILEREANTPESMRIVSGILQGRMSVGMPLQADASIEYVLDKPLGELTPEDLRTDSPYNTYTNLGLPPTPIGNPGLEAIRAVLEPTATEYVFYITGNDGNFYYAETYDEHRANIERYLR